MVDTFVKTHTTQGLYLNVNCGLGLIVTHHCGSLIFIKCTRWMQGVDGGEVVRPGGHEVWGVGGIICGGSAVSTQFCCEPKATLNNKD